MITVTDTTVNSQNDPSTDSAVNSQNDHSDSLHSQQSEWSTD